MKIHKIFPTTILQFPFSLHTNYSFSVQEEKVNKPVGWIMDVNSSFPAATGDSFITDKQIFDLKRDISFEIGKVFNFLGFTFDYEIKELWYNIYNKAQGQEIHSHLSHLPNKNPIWSGIYYNKNCSQTSTRFHRSDFAYKTQLFDGCLDCMISDSYYENWSPEIKDGDIILFPPHLSHDVVNSIDKQRITFAFNIDII